MRNFKEILDLLGEMKAQLRIDDPMNHYDKIIEIENHLFAEQNKQTDLVGYIHKDDLEKLRSDNAGNHLTVGIDTRQAWPTGPGESKPYDWLVAVYTRPAQAAQPPSAQSWELDEESCKFLADMITADPDQITRVGFHLGYAKDDDGKLVHGFSVYEAEYPEEGVHTLVETKTHPPAQPNCGACPGDGTVCKTSCRVAAECPDPDARINEYQDCHDVLLAVKEQFDRFGDRFPDGFDSRVFRWVDDAIAATQSSKKVGM